MNEILGDEDKSIWLSHGWDSAVRLYVVESRLNAAILSQLRTSNVNGYAATYGDLTQENMKPLMKVIEHMAERNSPVFVAFSNDRLGEVMSDLLIAKARRAGFGFCVTRERPNGRYWVDDLISARA